MLKYDKNRIVPAQKSESQPLHKNIEKADPLSGVNPKDNPRRDETANLFEDHIQEVKKEGD
jgi:hypothetical protein